MDRGIGIVPSLPPGVYGRRPAQGLPYPLSQPECALYSRTRHALWQGAQALGLGPGDAVLVPAYHHGAEVEALVRVGIEPCFYDGSERLEPGEHELESLLGPTVKALLLVHYLGFPQDAARWRAWCDERGLLLLEDAGKAWLAARDGIPVGTHGDLAVFGLQRTYGVPDGGALLVGAPTPLPEAQARWGLQPLLRSHARWLVARAPLLSAVEVSEGVPEADFDLGDPGAPATRATRFLLPRLADRHTAVRRRSNYAYLLDELGDLASAPFEELPEGAMPFVFPIEARDKTGLLGRLAERGIDALDLWPRPHPSLPADGFPRATARRARTVALPVHQELRADDLERVAAAVRTRRPAVTRFQLEPLESLDDARDFWDELAAASRNIFATCEWATIWWRHFGAGRTLRSSLCRSESGRVVAILPLYQFSDGPLALVRFVGHGPADQLGPICAPADRATAKRALRQAVDGLKDDIFLAEYLPASEGWNVLPGARVLRREASPVLQFKGRTWDEVLASWSSNRRQQARRFERRLQREHGLRYRLSVDPDRLPDDLNTLFRLHEARWSGALSAFSGRAAKFHRDFAAVALERGWLRLWFLEADGEPVAAWYGFRFANVESFYQAGRDPAWENRSVGLVLLLHSIRSALEDGMTEYRFLRGAESFKYRFASHDPAVETIGVGCSLLGDAALAAGAVLPGALLRPLRPHIAG